MTEVERKRGFVNWAGHILSSLMPGKGILKQKVTSKASPEYGSLAKMIQVENKMTKQDF